MEEAHVGMVIYPMTLCKVKCVVTRADTVEYSHGASKVQMVQIQCHGVVHFVRSS